MMEASRALFLKRCVMMVVGILFISICVGCFHLLAGAGCFSDSYDLTPSDSCSFDRVSVCRPGGGILYGSGNGNCSL